MSIVLFILALLIFDAHVPSNLFMYFVTLEIFIIASLSIGTILGLTVKSTSKLTMVSQLVFLPSIMLSGIMFPVEMLPIVLQSIGGIFPATWGFINLTSNQWEITNIAPLIIAIIFAFLISGWRLGRLQTEE